MSNSKYRRIPKVTPLPFLISYSLPSHFKPKVTVPRKLQPTRKKLVANYLISSAIRMEQPDCSTEQFENYILRTKLNFTGRQFCYVIKIVWWFPWNSTHEIMALSSSSHQFTPQSADVILVRTYKIYKMQLWNRIQFASHKYCLKVFTLISRFCCGLHAD